MSHPLICPICKYNRPLALTYCPNCRKQTKKKLASIPQLKAVVQKTEKKMKLEVKKINVTQNLEKKSGWKNTNIKKKGSVKKV